MPLASQERVEGGLPIRSANTEDKAQRRQNVAKNGLDLGAWRGVDSVS